MEPLWEAYRDSGDRLMESLDRSYWRGRDALRAAKGVLSGE